MAKFSHSKEFKALKEHLEQRIEFYQQFFPGNTDKPVTGEDWRVANTVVGEFKAVIGAYEQAAQTVKDATS